MSALPSALAIIEASRARAGAGVGKLGLIVESEQFVPETVRTLAKRGAELIAQCVKYSRSESLIAGQRARS